MKKVNITYLQECTSNGRVGECHGKIDNECQYNLSNIPSESPLREPSLVPNTVQIEEINSTIRKQCNVSNGRKFFEDVTNTNIHSNLSNLAQR